MKGWQPDTRGSDKGITNFSSYFGILGGGLGFPFVELPLDFYFLNTLLECSRSLRIRKGAFLMAPFPKDCVSFTDGSN